MSNNLQWNPVGVNFSGSGQERSNVTSALSSAGNIFDSLHKNLALKEQNEFENSIKTANLAIAQSVEQRAVDTYEKGLADERDYNLATDLGQAALIRNTRKDGSINLQGLGNEISGYMQQTDSKISQDYFIDMYNTYTKSTLDSTEKAKDRSMQFGLVAQKQKGAEDLLRMQLEHREKNPALYSGSKGSNASVTNKLLEQEYKNKQAAWENFNLLADEELLARGAEANDLTNSYSKAQVRTLESNAKKAGVSADTLMNALSYNLEQGANFPLLGRIGHGVAEDTAKDVFGPLQALMASNFNDITTIVNKKGELKVAQDLLQMFFMDIGKDGIPLTEEMHDSLMQLAATGKLKRGDK